jgi:hypothetical protein
MRVKCPHNKAKSKCKDCGGGSFCEHGKQRVRCKNCGGKGICEHGREKYHCKECGGSGICEHGKYKSRCKECKGVSMCNHGRRKYRCKDCVGSGICEHGKEKRVCRECEGSGICVHGKDKFICKDCGGVGICEHGKRKSRCKDCGGASICNHGKVKSYCKSCGGSALCKTPFCETIGHKKYEGYCLSCCVQVCPEIQVSRNYKTKEKDVVDRLLQHYKDFTWIADKTIKDGCSKRRPDLLLDLGSHIIIVEVDENKHSAYNSSCENKRLMELSQDVGHRPIVFIRFNPDSYTDETGIKISSCWIPNKYGVLTVPQSKEKEWNHRIETLLGQIDNWVKNTTEKTIEIIQLFY